MRIQSVLKFSGEGALHVRPHYSLHSGGHSIVASGEFKGESPAQKMYFPDKNFKVIQDATKAPPMIKLNPKGVMLCTETKHIKKEDEFRGETKANYFNFDNTGKLLRGVQTNTYTFPIDVDDIQIPTRNLLETIAKDVIEIRKQK